jgi:hypothetical protein
VLAAGGFGFHGGPYVDLSLARANVMLTRADASAFEALDGLSHDPAVPAHVRWSAARWLVCALRSLHREADSRQAQKRLDVASHEHPAGRRYALLAQLDAAIAEGHADVADRVLAMLETSDPGPLVHLLSDSRDPARAARLYPY